MVNYNKRYEMLETDKNAVPGVTVIEVRRCKRCGRRLKTEDAIERGMGKTCWLKTQTSQDKKPLFRSYVDDKRI